MSRYDDLPDAARSLMENFDEIDLAEMLAGANGRIGELKAKAAEAEALEQRLHEFLRELEMAGRANQAPLPYDVLAATIRHRILDPAVPNITGPEKAEATP